MVKRVHGTQNAKINLPVERKSVERLDNFEVSPVIASIHSQAIVPKHTSMNMNTVNNEIQGTIEAVTGHRGIYPAEQG